MLHSFTMSQSFIPDMLFIGIFFYASLSPWLWSHPWVVHWIMPLIYAVCVHWEHMWNVSYVRQPKIKVMGNWTTKLLSNHSSSGQQSLGTLSAADTIPYSAPCSAMQSEAHATNLPRTTIVCRGSNPEPSQFGGLANLPSDTKPRIPLPFGVQFPISLILGCLTW